MAAGSAGSAAAQPTSPYVDTDTAIERFRNGRSIFTPPHEFQAAITNALRATGKLDDFEVDAFRARQRHEDGTLAPPPLSDSPTPPS